MQSRLLGQSEMLCYRMARKRLGRFKMLHDAPITSFSKRSSGCAVARCHMSCPSRFFPAFLTFFWTWRPSRNIVIYVSKVTFLFFSVLIFQETIQQNAPKSRPKNASTKVGKHVVPGTPWGPPNHRKLDRPK